MKLDDVFVKSIKMKSKKLVSLKLHSSIHITGIADEDAKIKDLKLNAIH